jgi:hypothetical protein
MADRLWRGENLMAGVWIDHAVHFLACLRAARIKMDSCWRYVYGPRLVGESALTHKFYRRTGKVYVSIGQNRSRWAGGSSEEASREVTLPLNFPSTRRFSLSSCADVGMHVISIDSIHHRTHLIINSALTFAPVHQHITRVRGVICHVAMCCVEEPPRLKLWMYGKNSKHALELLRGRPAIASHHHVCHVCARSPLQ